MAIETRVEDPMGSDRGGGKTDDDTGLWFDTSGFKGPHDGAKGKGYTVGEVVIAIVGAV